ncbi:hypothetical protein ACIQJT_16550 [Streptomyces sp. NPDC091972]
MPCEPGAPITAPNTLPATATRHHAVRRPIPRHPSALLRPVLG